MFQIKAVEKDKSNQILSSITIFANPAVHETMWESTVEAGM